MTYYETPHEITDRSKAAGMIKTLRSGNTVPPIVVIGNQAITGSHRVYAANKTEIEIETVEVSDIDYLRACYVIDHDTHHDYPDINNFCAALFAVTDEQELKDALKDQIHGDDYLDTGRLSEAKEMNIEQLEEERGW